jgi:hypothetical protein
MRASGVPSDGAPIEGGHLYVAAPNLHLLVKKGRIVIGRGPQESRWRPSILCRLPHHVEIDVEITVGQAIAHVAHAPPWHLWMCLGELGVPVHHLRGGLTDDDEVHDDGM